MAKVALLAKIVANEGRRDEALDVLRAMVAAVQEEAGTEVYVLHTQDDDPNVIWVYELYTDLAARQAHGAGETFQTLRSSLQGLTAAPTEILTLTPLAATGLPV
ncbi:MAG: hypothetical protein NVSMB13_16860 [Mycobacteriales bacterium]